MTEFIVRQRRLDRAVRFTQEMADDIRLNRGKGKLTPQCIDVKYEAKSGKFYLHGLCEELCVWNWMVFNPEIGALDIVSDDKIWTLYEKNR